ENKWNPDVDDTAMVLLALRKIPTRDLKRRDDCFKRGLDWTMTFQCKDGGWGAFDKDCTKNILEKVPFADHNAMLDPECADITARILELLGYEGVGLDNPQVNEAIQFIREHQEEDGSWYGRWGVNYIYGTWQVQRGIEYLIRTQNEDGSWTEHETTGTGFPKVFYLKYDMYRNAWPLLALATYRNILEEVQAKKSGCVNGAVKESAAEEVLAGS